MSNNTQDREYLEKLDKDHIHVTTRPYLNKVEAHTEPYEVDVFGTSITVLPGVMSPKYDWAGVYLVDYMPQDFSGLDVLELGPGSGLVSVFAGLRGARSVTAVDINATAVENTKINLQKHGITNSVVLESDVFFAVAGRSFDMIIFNLPYHNGDPKSGLEKGVIDAGYAAMDTFFAQVRTFLKPGGRVIVGFSCSGDLARYRAAVQKSGLTEVAFDEKNEFDAPLYQGPDFHYNCQIYTYRATV